jgi:hypothetical protein
MPGRLFIPLCAVAALAVLAGCGGGTASPTGATPGNAAPGSAAPGNAAPPSVATASPRRTGSQVDLKKTAACTLATTGEAAAALGVPVKQSYNSPPLEGIGCDYSTASSEVYLLIQVQPDPDSYFDPKLSNGRPIAGLGDDAYAARSILDTGEKIEVLVGDLVLTIQRIDPAKNTDIAAIDERLARLAHLVIPRLPH